MRPIKPCRVLALGVKTGFVQLFNAEPLHATAAVFYLHAYINMSNVPFIFFFLEVFFRPTAVNALLSDRIKATAVSCLAGGWFSGLAERNQSREQGSGMPTQLSPR